MIGKRLKSLRKMYDMTQEDVGKKLGVTKATIQRYEAEKITIPYDRLCQLADIFQVQPAYLFPNKEIESTTNKDKEIERAMQLFEYYKKADPQIQKAVEVLLKAPESDS